MKKSTLIKILFFFGLFLFFLLPPTDPDLGWHLRCGEEIWTKHTLCNINNFSVLLSGYEWINHFWLYQTILFPIYKFSGLWGLTVFNAVIVSLSFFFFYLSIKNFAFEKILAIFTIIFFGWGVFSFGIRAQLFGFLFFNILLFLLSKIKEKPKLAFFIPLTMLFWANTHGSVILGLILLGFFYLKQLMSFWNEVRRIGGRSDRILKRCYRSLRSLQHDNNRVTLAPSKNVKLFALSSFLFAFSAIVTLANPFGLAIYQEAFRHVAGPIDLSKLIAEWVPPNPNIYWTIIVSGFCLLLFYLITAAPREIIFGFLLLPFAFLAMSARRHVHFYFTILFYLLFIPPTTKKLLHTWQKQKVLRQYLAITTALLFLSVGLVFRLTRTYRTNRSWTDYCQASPVTVPCQAVKFLREQNAQSLPAERRGNIFNRYEWGGFLIWQLPDYKVFVDGRMPAWRDATRSLSERWADKSPYTIYLETLQTQPGWEETLKKYNIDWILISPGTFMDLLLQPDPAKFGWQEVYRDKISVIYHAIETD